MCVCDDSLTTHVLLCVEVRNLGGSSNRCLDCAISRHEKKKPLELYGCHGAGGNQLRNQAASFCADSAIGDDNDGKPVIPYPCHEQGGNQVCQE
ncbi:unnamed protein product [Nippostrongylus brasiliensis]|uniref:Ricin B-type lectin domain-containing protein n=1 Tax=Nippostrongylus brasiliensis TaxID=27835 RepID=A0A0N4XNE3_NIPBR|nr:unnamed protein product [Nippostrongylus brasiliensis]